MMPMYNNSNNLMSICTMWKGSHYGERTRRYDKIANNTGENGSQYRKKSYAKILGYTLSTRFLATAAFCHHCSAAIFSNRLSRHNSASAGLQRPAKNPEINKNTAFYDFAESTAAVAKKRAFDKLLAAVFKLAKDCGLIEKNCQASIDSTGMESSYVSRHFLMRQGKRTNKYRRWTKLTIVGDNSNHLIAGATVDLGPSNDNPGLVPTVSQAVEHLPISCLLGDSGYDSDNNHRICRKQFGIRSTVIAINNRYYKGGPLQGSYRRQMKEHFPVHKYHQRWQIESIFSRFKRRLGHCLRSRSEQSRGVECLFRVLTYNLMILYLFFSKNAFKQITI